MRKLPSTNSIIKMAEGKGVSILKWSLLQVLVTSTIEEFQKPMQVMAASTHSLFQKTWDNLLLVSLCRLVMHQLEFMCRLFLTLH